MGGLNHTKNRTGGEHDPGLLLYKQADTASMVLRGST